MSLSTTLSGSRREALRARLFLFISIIMLTNSSAFIKFKTISYINIIVHLNDIVTNIDMTS